MSKDPLKHIIRTLISLNGYSTTSAAFAAKVDQSLLSSWLNHNRPLGDKKIRKVAKILGFDLDEGRLEAAGVHVWKVNPDLKDLDFALNNFFENPQVTPVVMKRSRRPSEQEVIKSARAIIADDKGVKVFMTLDGLANTDSSHPSLFTTYCDNSAPIEVSARILDQWKKGDVTPQAFNKARRQAGEVDWQMVLDKADEFDVEPSEIYDLLVDMNKRNIPKAAK